MKLLELRQLASERLNTLYSQKSKLTEILENSNELPSQNNPNFDVVEISKAISDIDKEYEQVSNIANKLSVIDTSIQNAEASKQQAEAAEKEIKELMKILEVFRRIAKGDKVPPADEKKLMEYSLEMYMAAKNMALMNINDKSEEHESLWEEETDEEEPSNPAEVANNTEVGNLLAEVPTSPEISQMCSDLENG